MFVFISCYSWREFAISHVPHSMDEGKSIGRVSKMEVGVVSNFYTRPMDDSDMLPIIVFYFLLYTSFLFTGRLGEREDDDFGK